MLIPDYMSIRVYIFVKTHQSVHLTFIKRKEEKMLSNGVATITNSTNGKLKQQVVSSQFWRLDIQDQAVYGAGFS